MVVLFVSLCLCGSMASADARRFIFSVVSFASCKKTSARRHAGWKPALRNSGLRSQVSHCGLCVEDPIHPDFDTEDTESPEGLCGLAAWRETGLKRQASDTGGWLAQGRSGAKEKPET